jgi:hypothetical protein
MPDAAVHPALPAGPASSPTARQVERPPAAARRDAHPQAARQVGPHRARLRDAPPLVLLCWDAPRPATTPPAERSQAPTARAAVE